MVSFGCKLKLPACLKLTKGILALTYPLSWCLQALKATTVCYANAAACLNAQNCFALVLHIDFQAFPCRLRSHFEILVFSPLHGLPLISTWSIYCISSTTNAKPISTVIFMHSLSLRNPLLVCVLLSSFPLVPKQMHIPNRIGTQGPQGPQGAHGVTGAKGSNGQNGATGSKGLITFDPFFARHFWDPFPSCDCSIADVCRW